MSDEVKKVVRTHQLGGHHCIELLRVEDQKLQLWLAEKVKKAVLSAQKASLWWKAIYTSLS